MFNNMYHTSDTEGDNGRKIYYHLLGLITIQNKSRCSGVKFDRYTAISNFLIGSEDQRTIQPSRPYHVLSVTALIFLCKTPNLSCRSWFHVPETCNPALKVPNSSTRLEIDCRRDSDLPIPPLSRPSEANLFGKPFCIRYTSWKRGD